MATIKINLVVSLVPVGARQADISNQVFALHLSAAFGEEGYAPEFEKLLHPWTWESNWDVKKMITAVKTSADTGEIIGKQFESDPLTETKNPSANPDTLKILQSKLVRDKEKKWTPDAIDNNSGVIEKAKLIEAVHSLSLYPGSSANDSNVLHYFKIVTTDWTPKNDDRLAAVPKFELNFNGKKIVFTPETFDLMIPGNFNFDEWQKGWKYKTDKDPLETNDFELRAFVKPLEITDVTGIFYDSGEIPSADSGLNFKDYWFRSQKSPLWQNRLEDFANAATDFEKRMAEAASFYFNLTDSKPEIAELWEDLRLMALGIYAQWGTLPGVDLLPHDKVAGIEKIKDFLLLTADEKAALETAVNRIHDNLKVGDRRQKRGLWLNVFRRAFGETILVVEDDEADRRFADNLLKRAAETPQDFQATVFYIWDSSVQKFGSDDLKVKWNGQNEETREKIKTVLSLSVVKAPFLKKQGLLPLTSKKNQLEVKDFIKERLTLLKSYFEHPEFVPPIVGAGETTAVWTALWDKFIESYLAGITELNTPVSDANLEFEPKFDTKPGGLTIQFDRLAERENLAPKDDESNWRKIAGVGVIVREEGKKWHLATAATVTTNFPEIEIKKTEFVDEKTLKITIDVDSIADAKHDLMIGGREFKAVFEARETSSGTIPANKIKITPSFAAPSSGGNLLTIESLDPNTKFTEKDAVEFVTRKRVLLAETAMIPVRVPYKNGIRYPFLTYNQRSLISPTALADAVKNSFAANDQRSGVNGVKWMPLYEYGAPDTTKDFYKLVPLKFGKKYQMSAFMVDTAGGLPVALQNGKPFIFEPNENPVMPADTAQDFQYWRKVPVGQVRLSALELTGGNKPKTWQEVPEKVFPLAWEVEPENPMNKGLAGTDADHPSEQKNRRKQLVLLYDESEKYSFGIKPPTVDIDVLERWLPFPGGQAELKGVLIDYFKRLNNQKSNAPGAVDDSNKNDLTIDDPAVENLLFVLEEYNFSNDPKANKWKVVSAYKHKIVNNLNAPDPPIKKYQSRWQKVICLRSSKNEVRKPVISDGAGFDVTVTVKSDAVNVVRLRVLALVDRKFVEGETGDAANKKFSKTFFAEKSPAIRQELAPDKPGDFLLQEDFDSYQIVSGSPEETTINEVKAQFFGLKSHRVLLETPNKKMPDAEKLWQSLALQLEGNNDTVKISLNNTQDETEKILRRNIVRCELRRQQWRWQGRPVEREKEIAKPADIESLKTIWAKNGVVEDPTDIDFLKWEMTAFAEMGEAFDLITISLPYSLNALELLYRDNFEKDIAARYMRYGLRVFSRYEGLFRRGIEPVTTKQPFKPKKGEHQEIVQLSGTGWQRALVRYQGAKPAKPLVQAIVPLTQPFTETEKTASLMLVLDQTAHAQCGITEQIECELMKVDLPKAIGQQTADKLFQAGHDPILRVDTPVLPDANIESVKFKLGGAFGHTFDTGARQPLFGSSSYVILADLANEKYKFDDWDFAKIRLRRLSGNENNQVAEENDWTDALWVQFPPSSNFVTGKTTSIILKPDNKTFEVNFPADAERFPMFKYCLILTQEISDFRGQKKSETYFGWVNLQSVSNPPKQLHGVFEKTTKFQNNLKARLAEIQVAPSQNINAFEDLPEKGSEFWDGLLKVENEGDSLNAKYRITRISAVIEITKEEN